MHWLGIITLIIQIFVFAFFITLAVFLGRLRGDKCQTAISPNTLNWLWIGTIIFAIITFIHMVGAIGALIWPNLGSGNPSNPEYTQLQHTTTGPPEQVIATQPIATQPVGQPIATQPVVYRQVPTRQSISGSQPILEGQTVMRR
jgi:hypothetical protein